MIPLGSGFRRVLFFLQGGHGLDGRKDEFSPRAFHFLLTCTLIWLGLQLFVVVPLFAVKKTAGTIIYLSMSGATLGALVFLRQGRERAAAALFLSVMWSTGMGVSTFNGGVGANGVYLALALSLNAAWLLGRSAAIWCAALTLGLSLTEALLETTGHLTPNLRSSPMTVWNGQILIVMLTINPILGVLSALRRQVDALRLSEHRFRTIVDAINDAVFICDLEKLEIVEINASACTLLGKTPEECRGVSIRQLATCAPDESKAGFFARVEAARTGAGQTFEYQLQRHDGSTMWIEITVQRSRVADSERLVLLARNIDSRKQAEEANAELEVRLQQAQKLESVGRLAGGVAHDFNNMLTVILGYSALLRREIVTDPTQLKYLSEIEKAGNRSKEITQQLLAFSRQQIIAPKPLQLNQLLTDLMEPLGRLIGEDIELSFFPGANLWTVVLDPSQVNQIVLNLVVNARDAMTSGGKLTIETSNATIPEEYCRMRPEALAGAFVVMAVSDTGSGIPAEILPRIFEPFFTTKGIHEGTGLGLAMIYGIAKQNGGFVNVYSEPGRGSTFRIYFPRMAGEQGVEEEPLGGEWALRGSGTVVVVEDDELVRDLVTASLERIGYTAVVATSPAHAIDLCSPEQGPDVRLVLTDVVMPGINGMVLRERIHEVNPGMRVLFMSGYTSNVIVKHGILKPGLHFIQKPFTVAELSRRIEEVLRTS